MRGSDTIVAAATPQGKGALAIIRLSGAQAFPITEACLFERALFEKAPPRSTLLYKIKDPETGRLLDQVTITRYVAPRSFTGEDLVEIVCHGGTRMVREITGALLKAGGRGATGGEFTRRALENGKIDLLHAEAIGGMIDSESEAALECSRRLYTAEGHSFRRWREELLDIAMVIEASIEFEEEIDADAMTRAKARIESFYESLDAELGKMENIRLLDRGLKVVIGGPANAGKSSLFNFLLGFDRSIVHQEPGTTRDLVSESVRIGEHEVVLVDSAGIRESVQEVEMTGIGLARKAISDSRAVIWVTAADEKASEGELAELNRTRDKNMLVVLNKIDRADGREKLEMLTREGFDAISVSIRSRKNCDELVSRIRQKIVCLHDKIDLPELLFNERQEGIGRELHKEIGEAIVEWVRPEIAAHHLRRAISCLDEFFGATNPEEIMNRVFEKFCIGK